MDDKTVSSTTPAVLGARLRSARDEAGMSLDDVMWEFRVRNIPEAMRMSRGKLGQIEKARVDKVDPWDLLLLATLYGKPLREISPEAADDIAEYRRVVTPIGSKSDRESREVDPTSPCSPDREPVAA